MSDYFQSIVYQVALDESAIQFSNRVRRWFIAREIIGAEPSNCTLGKPAHSFAPGRNYQCVATGAGNQLRGLSVNGVEFNIGRQVEISADEHEIHCAACQYQGEVDEAFYAAISTWYSGGDVVEFSCPNCGHVQPLIEWRVEPPCGFGHFIIRLRNWPLISEGFLIELKRFSINQFSIISGRI